MALFQVNQGNNQQQQPVNTGGTSRTKSILRYTMMPEILPRIRALGLHFGHFAYLLALVFSSARLIPHNHPVLNAANIGRFGVRQVIAMAANNVTWSMKNIDQIAIFGAIVMGLIMIVIQAGLIAFAALVGFNPAEASPVTSFFETPAANVGTDVVLIFLDQVFGPNLDIFGAASQPLGTAVHLGLQKILGFYSMAMMVIAVVIIVYYIMTVVGEAAKTGTPFGQRFNSLWAPIRLVVALGLLVPLGTGLNSAQYLTLWMAKMGSGLATQVWTQFVGGVTSGQNLITRPADQSTTNLVKRIFLSEVCAASYNQIENGSSSIQILQIVGGRAVAADLTDATSMIDAAVAAGDSDVIISWSNKNVGERETDGACGFINISLSDFDLYRDVGFAGGLDDGTQIGVSGDAYESGFWAWVFGGEAAGNILGTINNDIKAAYISQIKTISDTLKPEAEKIAEHQLSINATANYGDDAVLAGIEDVLQTVASNAYNAINLKISQSFTTMTGSSLSQSDIVDNMVQKGWGAAGMWYGNLGKLNQKFMEAVDSAAPTLGVILDAEEVTENERGLFGWMFGISRYGLTGSATSEIEQAINFAHQNYNNDIYRAGITPSDPLYREALLNGNQYADAESGVASGLLWILGGTQLYDLKNNPQLDPMARLMGAGSTIINRSLITFSAATVLSVGGSLAGAAPNPIVKKLGDLSKGVGAFLFTLVFVGLLAGIMLFYILPIIPFVYFSFAVMAWILEIFEAVVAMPLWALAHLRIDGDGMPGSAAIQGYALLLMILIRPALIVFGLIGGYVIFGAAVYFFSSIFNSATSVLHQDIAANELGAFGVFVYTLVFTFLVYNIALMCFKMIDDVPKGILRWLGVGAQTFGDSRSDPINGSREVLAATAVAGQQIGGGISSAKAKYQERGNLEAQSRQHNELLSAMGGGPKSPSPGSGGTGPGGGLSPAAQRSRNNKNIPKKP